MEIMDLFFVLKTVLGQVIVMFTVAFFYLKLLYYALPLHSNKNDNDNHTMITTWIYRLISVSLFLYFLFEVSADWTVHDCTFLNLGWFVLSPFCSRILYCSQDFLLSTWKRWNKTFYFGNVFAIHYADTLSTGKLKNKTGNKLSLL